LFSSGQYSELQQYVALPLQGSIAHWFLLSVCLSVCYFRACN